MGNVTRSSGPQTVNLGAGMRAGEYLETVRLDPCAYCGAPAPRVKYAATLNRYGQRVFVGGHLDHIVPGKAGGGDSWTNRTAACRPCNLSKAGTSLLGFLGLRRFRAAEGERLAALNAEKSAWCAVGHSLTKAKGGRR